MLERRSKIYTLMLALVLPLPLVPSTASSTTLTINGNLTTTPCVLTAPPVVLGRVPIIEFGPNGGMGSNYIVDFALTIADCEFETMRTANLTFTGTTVSGIANAEGLALTPTAGVAQGVAISLKNNDSTHGTLGESIRFNGTTTYPLDLASGKNTYDLRAAYVQVPGITVVPGPAASTLVVTITYT
jgi:type 1 fimbria pilin